MSLAGKWNASLAIQEIARFGLCIGRHILHGNQPNDLMSFSAPRKAGRRRQDQGKYDEHRPQKFPHNNLRQPASGDPPKAAGTVSPRSWAGKMTLRLWKCGPANDEVQRLAVQSGEVLEFNHIYLPFSNFAPGGFSAV
jgi:hypothetical protein